MLCKKHWIVKILMCCVKMNFMYFWLTLYIVIISNKFCYDSFLIHTKKSNQCTAWECHWMIQYIWCVLSMYNSGQPAIFMTVTGYPFPHHTSHTSTRASVTNWNVDGFLKSRKHFLCWIKLKLWAVTFELRNRNKVHF